MSRHHHGSGLLSTTVVGLWAALGAGLAIAAPVDPAAIAREVVGSAIGLAPEQVRVISVAARVFGDGSLDCPRPGQVYAQVVTPGHAVKVEAGGRRFDVRVAGGSGRICRNPGDPDRTRAPAADTGMAGEAARRDLAGALGLPVESVRVTRLRPARPGDRLPGCESACGDQEGRANGRADCGTVVELSAGGRDYQYLVTRAGPRSCPALARR